MSVLDNALQTLFKLGIEVKKRWTNASPTSIFNGQTITANMDGDVALIEFKLENDNPETFWDLCKIGSDGIASGLRSTTGADILAGNIGGQARSYEVNETGVKFSGSVFMYANDYQGKNDGCIPLNIYTIKLLGGAIANLLRRLFSGERRCAVCL